MSLPLSSPGAAQRAVAVTLPPGAPELAVRIFGAPGALATVGAPGAAGAPGACGVCGAGGAGGAGGVSAVKEACATGRGLPKASMAAARSVADSDRVIGRWNGTPLSRPGLLPFSV